MPDKADGIRKFLGGGIINGIGESLADRIVDKFGDKALEVMDSNINMLLAVDGIGKKKLKDISESWKSFNGNRENVIYLLSLGVSLASRGRVLTVIVKTSSICCLSEFLLATLPRYARNMAKKPSAQ